MQNTYLTIVLAPLIAAVIAGLFGRQIGRAALYPVSLLLERHPALRQPRLRRLCTWRVSVGGPQSQARHATTLSDAPWGVSAARVVSRAQ